MIRIRLLAGLLALAGVLSVCCGCGGGGSSNGSQNAANTGALEFSIIWPAPSRVIPAAARSLVIEVVFGSQTKRTQIIPRPPAGTNTSSTRFDSLPPGVVTVTVTAYPNADGSGVAQAIGGTTVAIISGVTTQATIDPSSTVDHIDLIPNPVVTIPNRTVQIVPSPRNAQNALVLVAPSSLRWTSSVPTVAVVDAAGLVRAITLGDSVVRVVDTESGQTAAVDVRVVAPLVIDPAQATVSIGDTVQFSATVTALASSKVTWTVLEPRSGGTISASGLYTAPGQPGTFHVVATSVSDPSISATATIVVQSGSGTVIIR